MDIVMDSPDVIVVGVDGSADSRLALEYAAREAVRRAASLRVVSVFESSGIFGARYGVPIPVSDEQIAKNVEEETLSMVSDVFDALRERPPAQAVVRAGSAGPVLADESAAADLLVIGHRGLGGLAGTLLGSVGMHCVLHAHCPVTVVRPAAKRAVAPAADTESAATAG
jgi:nucleotide-binding universal stress UspA family protein